MRKLQGAGEHVPQFPIPDDANSKNNPFDYFA